jgi:predicted lipid-binding transport protein (Tim44 family)
MRTTNSLWLSLCLAGALALAPSLADARAGSSKSSGSRGERTYQAPPSTNTAPNQAKPMERSTQSPQTQRQAQPAGSQPGFFQRNPFLGGLLGGLVGAGLIGMLMGSGFLSGGFAGMLGMLLQVALIGGLIYLVVAFLRRRKQPEGDRPAYAGAATQTGPLAYGQPQDQGMQRSGIPPVRPLDLGTGSTGPGYAPAARSADRSDEIGIRDADYQEFERLLVDVQTAWSKGDVGALRQLMTAEMLGYFTDELSANASRGIENHVEDGRLEQGDLAEAWREGDVEYATIAMRFSMLDYGKRDGRVVEGSDTKRVEATEIWTMRRQRGGRWILSAIQQTE